MRAAALQLALLLPSDTLAQPAPASAPDPKPHVLLVVGAAGEDTYEPIFANCEKLWREAALRGGAEVHTIGLGPVASPESDEDRRAFQKALEPLSQTNPTPAWIVLIGHGTDNGKEAKFNLRGPDFSAAELAAWLKPAQRPLVIVNTASSSGAFLKPLAATNRIVLTATRSGAELNFPRFGQYLAESIGSIQADLDKDRQTSLLEAFLFASRRVADFYKDEGRLATEHALIDDNGDGLGTPSDWFQGVRAVKKAQKNAAASRSDDVVDGRRARMLHLISNPEDQKLSPDERARRDGLELKIAALRDRKATLSKDEYYAALEVLLLDLARLYEASEGAR